MMESKNKFKINNIILLDSTDASYRGDRYKMMVKVKAKSAPNEVRCEVLHDYRGNWPVKHIYVNYFGLGKDCKVMNAKALKVLYSDK